MHAWLCEQPIGVDHLRWAELSTPEPSAGQVRIAIRAASLNFPDLLIVQNKYQHKPPLPFVPGSEFAGVEGRIDRRCVLGRLRAPRTEGQRRRAAGTVALVCRGQGQAGHRPGALPMARLHDAYARMAARQALGKLVMVNA